MPRECTVPQSEVIRAILLDDTSSPCCEHLPAAGDLVLNHAVIAEEAEPAVITSKSRYTSPICRSRYTFCTGPGAQGTYECAAVFSGRIGQNRMRREEKKRRREEEKEEKEEKRMRRLKEKEGHPGKKDDFCGTAVGSRGGVEEELRGGRTL